MKKVTLTKLGVGSFAKVNGVAAATLAFIVGVISSLSVAADELTEGSSIVVSLGIDLTVFGLAAVIFPIVGYFLGWIHGAIVALVLNFIFKESNGLSLEIEDK